MGWFGWLNSSLYIFKAVRFILAACMDPGSNPGISTKKHDMGMLWNWQQDKDIKRLRVTGEQVNSVKAGIFASLAAIRLLATKEIVNEESVFAMAA